MAKLSETYKIGTTTKNETNGSGIAAPASFGVKLSDRYQLGANTYQAPKVEFKQVSSVLSPSELNVLTSPANTIPQLETTQTQELPTNSFDIRSDKPYASNEFGSKLLSGIKNLFSNSTPTIPKVGQTNSTSIMNKTNAKIKNENYQQELRNKELATFDAQDKSPVIFTGKNGNNITRDKLNLWLQPDYQLSKDEIKQAKEYYNKEMNDVRKRGIENFTTGKSGYAYDGQEQELWLLSTKINKAKEFGYAFFNELPGAKQGNELLAKYVDKKTGTNEASNYLNTLEDTFENSKTYNAGKAASKMTQYITLNKSGVLDPITSKLSNAFVKFLGEKMGGHVASILSDEVADILLDTIPEMAENINDGMSANEVKNAVLKNLGINLAYNLGGEAIPSVVAWFKSRGKNITEEMAEEIIKNADDISDAVAKEVSSKAAESTSVKEIIDNLSDADKEKLKAFSREYDTLKYKAMGSDRYSADYDKEAKTLADEMAKSFPNLFEGSRPKFTAKDVGAWGDAVTKPLVNLEEPTAENIFKSTKEIPNVADEVAPVVKQTEVPKAAKQATVENATRKYTQNEIDDIQSYKNYRNRLMEMAKSHADNPQLTFSTMDTINRMDNEMWQKYPELFDNGNFKGVPKLTDEIPNVTKSYSGSKISDVSMNKRLNDQFNMFANTDEGKALSKELKQAMNEYEALKTPEAYERLMQLTKKAEGMMEGKTYQWKRDSGKRSGKVRQTSYPNSRGTITENVTSFVDGINKADNFVKQTNEAYREQIGNIANVLKSKNAESYAWDALDDIRKTLDGFVETGDEAVLESTLEAVEDLTKSAGINYADIQKDFEESVENAVLANQKANFNKVMAEDIGLDDEVSELVAPFEIKAEAPKIPDGKELPPLEVEGGPVSQFMTGSTKTVTDPETYEKIFKPIEDLNRHVVKTADYINDVSDARLKTNGVVDPQKVNEWKRALSFADNLSMEDVATAFDIKAYLEETKQVEALQDFWSRVRPHITNDAQVLNYLSQLKRNTIDGAIEGALGKMRKDIDKHVHKEGFSDAINNFAYQVEDAIKSGNLDKINDLFNKNLSEFAYGDVAKKRLKRTVAKGENKVANIIKKAKPGTTEDEIAKEVSSAIRKLNGVADITAADEAAVKELLTEASQYDKSSRQFKELQAKAAKIFANKVPSSFAEQVKTYLYDNMLGNLKTGLTRNAGGNIISNTLEGVQKPLKVGIDKLASLKTGERNYILSPEVSKAYAQGFKKGLVDQTLDVLHRTNTTRSGEESFADAIRNVHKAFKGHNPISKVLGVYDDAVKAVMTYGDRPFYEGAYAATKAELNEIVKRYGEEAISQVGVPKEALASLDDTIEFLAKGRALESVFQKGSLSADAFKKFKEALGDLSRDVVGVDVLSQFSMPFVQVPANMISRLSDYIPGIGTIKNVANTLGETKWGGGFDQRRFVDATSRNLTGLGLFAGGVALADNAKNGGFGISGSLGKDKDQKAAQINAGEQQYALQLPSGRQIDVSDIPTLGPMMQSSASFAEAVRDNEGDIGKGLLEGTKQALSSAVETSALQSLNKLFGTNTYGEGGFGDNIMQIIGTGLSQGVPSSVRQLTQVIDPYKRDLGEYNTLNYYLNNVINATPFRMSALNPKLDNEGNIIKQNQGRSTEMKVLENMLLPWTITDPEYTNLGKTANRLYEETSDNTTRAYPTVPTRSVAKKWLGDKYNDQTYYDLTKRAGRLNSDLGNAVINSSFFTKLSPDDQAKVLSDIYTAINALVREEVEKGYESDNTLAKKYKKGKKKAVIEYLKDRYSKEIPTLK